MKAVRFHEHGGPEVLKYEDIPEPKINATEILVRVKACSLNHLDLWTRKGMPGVKVPLPHISGCDIAGEVAAVGDLAARMKAGDKIVVAPGLSCMQCPACLGGHDNQCRQYEIIGGYRVDGGFAEYVRVPEVNAIPLPPGLSFEQAAAIPLVFLTAWNMLVNQAKVTAGEEVLVVGAGSGVGSAAVQIAKLFGARVIATAGDDAKLAKAKALGADEAINHATQDIQQEVRRITNKRGVDVVFEHVGAAVWEKVLLSLAQGGRLVTCGATTGPDLKTDARYLFMRNLHIVGTFMGSKFDTLEVFRHVAAGRLKPVLDRTFPLKEAAQAQRMLEDRKQFGKLVLVP
jgi:NADPH:quinone reductase-like Zn-dependent oxidoreductase